MIWNKKNITITIPFPSLPIHYFIKIKLGKTIIWFFPFDWSNNYTTVVGNSWRPFTWYSP